MSYLQVLKVEEPVKETKQETIEGTYEEIQEQLQQKKMPIQKAERYEDRDIFLIDNTETTSSVIFFLRDKYPCLFYNTFNHEILDLLRECVTVEEVKVEDESGDEEEYENYFGIE